MARVPGAERSGTAKRREEPSPSQALILEYQSYVHRIVGFLVKSMGLPGDQFEEFVAAGYLGLVEAATRYDERTGTSFKSFAFLRIRGAVIDSIRECSQLSGKAYRVAKALHGAQKLEPHPVESPPESDPSLTLAEIFEHAAKGVFAFRLSNIDADVEISELYPQDGPEEVFEDHEDRKLFSRLIATLPEKERIIIEEYYFHEKSFTEIADAHEGMSKSWVSRLHTRALELLKQRYLEEIEGI